MVFRLLADVTVLVHLAFVVFVLLGGLLVVRRPRVAWLHVPAVAWGAWIEFAGWLCPLTPLENWLRTRSGLAAYDSSFIEHYLLPLLYPASLSRELQWVLGSIVLLVNGVLYLVVLRRRFTRMARGWRDPPRAG
jgi:small-conductance mechanosensitive channel